MSKRLQRCVRIKEKGCGNILREEKFSEKTTPKRKEKVKLRSLSRPKGFRV